MFWTSSTVKVSILGSCRFETEMFCSSTLAGTFPDDIMQLNYDRYGKSRLSRNLQYFDRAERKAHFERLQSQSDAVDREPTSIIQGVQEENDATSR